MAMFQENDPYINLRRSHELPLGVRRGQPAGRCGKGVDVGVCVIALLHLLILGKCYAVHIKASSL